MEWEIIAALFFLGTISASFMGLVAARLHTGQSIIAGRSQCDACGRTLSFLSLVPIFSFVAGKGRSLCCGVRLSPVSPISELLLGILFALSYEMVGLSQALPGLLISLALLEALVLYDLAHQILPPILLSAFVGAAAATGYFLYADFLSFIVPMATVLGGILLLIYIASGGRAMGFSDAPLAFGLSLLAGPLSPSGFVYSFWIGAVIGIGVLLARPAGSRMGIEVPFAPFLACGFLLSYFTQWNLLDIGVLLSAFP